MIKNANKSMQDINHAVSGFKDHFAVFNECENYHGSKLCPITVINRNHPIEAKQKALDPCNTKSKSSPPFIHCCTKNKFIYVLHDLAVGCISNLLLFKPDNQALNKE